MQKVFEDIGMTNNFIVEMEGFEVGQVQGFTEPDIDVSLSAYGGTVNESPVQVPSGKKYSNIKIKSLEVKENADALIDWFENSTYENKVVTVKALDKDGAVYKTTKYTCVPAKIAGVEYEYAESGEAVIREIELAVNNIERL